MCYCANAFGFLAPAKKNDKNYAVMPLRIWLQRVFRDPRLIK